MDLEHSIILLKLAKDIKFGEDIQVWVYITLMLPIILFWLKNLIKSFSGVLNEILNIRDLLGDINGKEPEKQKQIEQKDEES